VWPCAVARLRVFLPVAMIVGLVVAVALFWWQASALSVVGIAGDRTGGAGNWSEVEATLRERYLWAMAGVVVLQAVLCAVLRTLLRRGEIR